MNLPINCATTYFPIKEKYIDDETSVLSRWMVFGSHPGEDTVDVCDSQGVDIFTHMSTVLAMDIVRERNIWVGKLLEQLNGKRACPGWPPV